MGRDYLWLLLVSIALSVPLAWWIMDGWLQDFAYRIPISLWIFSAPSLIVVFIAMMTVSVHTIRAARTSPATSLRYE